MWSERKKTTQDEALLASLLQSCPYFEVRANAAAMLGALSGLNPAAGDDSGGAAVRAARVEAAGALLKGVLDAEAHVMVLAAVRADGERRMANGCPTIVCRGACPL